MCEDLTRRDFIRGSGVALLGFPFLAPAVRAASRYRTERVVLVAFAGGVRSRETVQAPANIPNLMRIAEKGVLCPDINVINNGHFGATMSIFTGKVELRGIRENERGENPTVFEYVRKGRAIEADSTWLSTSGGAQQRNLVYSRHPDYGEAYGANLIDAEGIFNTELRRVIDSFGRPTVPGEAEEAALAGLRAAMVPPPPVEGSVANDAATVERLQRYILEEISGRTARITGPGSSDARAIAVAVSVLRVFRPTLMGVVLQNADVAHSSYNAYVEVIRRADEQLGRLWDAIQADPELRETTSVFVLPEFGRDRNLNQRNGLDHGDSSPDLLKVAMIAAGPDLKKGRTVRTAMRSIDVCPTIGELLGVRTEHAAGRVMSAILER